MSLGLKPGIAKNGKIYTKEHIMTGNEIQMQIQSKTETFLVESYKALDGNKAAAARTRKISLEIEKLLKLWRGVSTGRISE